MKNLYLTVSFACAAFMFPPAVIACRAARPSPQVLVSNAETIVRAAATRYVRTPEGNIRALGEPRDAEIEFSVKEVIKGENIAPRIILNGYLTDRDDFNDGPVPYDFVRKGGRGGSCSAYEYKRGAEFLLFLKKVDGELTIRWYALAPTNEQLRSPDDPWAVWVKEQLKSSEKKEAPLHAVLFRAFDIWASRFSLAGAN